MNQSEPSTKLLQMRGISKSFGSVRVLDGVDFDLHAGEVHVLAGENGAGKSTLVKILAGIHDTYDGTIELSGRTVRFATSHAANLAGISVIHQEMSLIESLSVVDNLFLGRESAHVAGWWLDRSAQITRALEVCRQLGLAFTAADLAILVEHFSLSMKNRLEIAKALVFDARILVMDEPTSALNQTEAQKLFTLIDTLRHRGCGIVYISHKMEEIYQLADRITVLRDGCLVGTAPVAECPEPTLIQWMVGRELSDRIYATGETLCASKVPPRLEISGFTVPHRDPAHPAAVRDFSLSAHQGEIVGIAGLQGSGNSELFRGLFGADGPVYSGSVTLDGIPFRPDNPIDSIRAGIAWLTPDRKRTGLVLDLGICDNVTLSSLPEHSPGGWLRPDRERNFAALQREKFHIRLTSLDQPVGTLSGGNQQKAVLAKWLATHPKVFLLEEPTRGVDVGAKHEIYSLMRQWTATGMTILLISSEMPELLGLSDRIVVLHRGTIAAHFDRTEATPEKVLSAAMGSTPTNAV